MTEVINVPHPVSLRITKRSFWTRFPFTNQVAMRAIMAQGSPAYLAGLFATLDKLVSESPWVQLDLPQLVQLVGSLGQPTIPETVTLDGQQYPLRLTPAQIAALMYVPPTEAEIYRGIDA